MKLLKYVLGFITFIGGVFALSASSKKKGKQEFDTKVKENEEKIKIVQVKTSKVEK